MPKFSKAILRPIIPSRINITKHRELNIEVNARTEEISWDAMAATMANDYLKIYNDNANTINK